MRPWLVATIVLLLSSGCHEPSTQVTPTDDAGRATTDPEPDPQGDGSPGEGSGAGGNGTAGHNATGGTTAGDPNGTATPAPQWPGFEMNVLELNPPGPDAGQEFLYICNNATVAGSLEDWKLEARAGATTTYVFGGPFFPAGTREGHAVCDRIDLAGTFFPDAGVSVALLRPDGTVVQATPSLSDLADDAGIWVRAFNGTWEWQP